MVKKDSVCTSCNCKLMSSQGSVSFNCPGCSKQEIINSMKIVNKKKQKITIKNFEKNLYTFGFPNPDILIRTGSQSRLSNFLLWQIAYTEIFFVKKMWPDFNKKDFQKILNKFKKIKRNFGKIQ